MNYQMLSQALGGQLGGGAGPGAQVRARARLLLVASKPLGFKARLPPSLHRTP